MNNEPIRVVVDTNVVISAVNFGGAPAAILSFALIGIVQVYISEFILEEIDSVLQKKFAWDAAKRKSLQSFLHRIVFLAEPTERITVIVDDPDNRILECAIACDADFIISGDTDLLELTTFRSIPIYSVRQFLDARVDPR